MTEDVRPDYFAVPDPLDESKLSYWYRPKRGGRAGDILPWPPRRNRWGRLTWAEVNAQPADQREAFQIKHWERVRTARVIVAERIETAPTWFAALFASAQSICCCCGKALTDPRSKAYGIGPDCRQGIDPERLAELIAMMRTAHAKGRMSWVLNSADDPELFTSTS